MTKFVNCTPHCINLFLENKSVKVFPRCDLPARLEETVKTSIVLDGVTIAETVFGKVQNLPEPEDNTFYIVSRLVLSASPGRKDLLVPNNLLRDSEGNVIGCKELARN